MIGLKPGSPEAIEYFNALDDQDSIQVGASLGDDLELIVNVFEHLWKYGIGESLIYSEDALDG